MGAPVAACRRYLLARDDPQGVAEGSVARIAEREPPVSGPPAAGLHQQGLDAASFADHLVLAREEDTGRAPVGLGDDPDLAATVEGVGAEDPGPVLEGTAVGSLVVAVNLTPVSRGVALQVREHQQLRAVYGLPCLPKRLKSTGCGDDPA